VVLSTDTELPEGTPVTSGQPLRLGPKTIVVVRSV